MEDYEEFGLGGGRGEEEKGGGGGVFGFWFFGSSSGLEFEAERYYLVDVMQIYICIWMVGMLSSVLHYIYHVLANELGNKALSTD